MASSYPTAPGRKMPLDKDGSIAWFGQSPSAVGGLDTAGLLDTTTIVQLTPTQLTNQQDTDPYTVHGSAFGGPGTNFAGFLTYIFPELRDVLGINLYCSQVPYVTGNGSANITFSVQYSPNSFNGISGTWNTYISSGQISWNSDIDPQAYDFWGVSGGFSSFFANRLAFQTVNWPSTRSLRFFHRPQYALTGTHASWAEIHIYGRIASGQTPDRLLFIDSATGLEFTEVFDWGDIPRGSTFEKTLWVLNNSGTYTANNFTLDFLAFVGGSDGWHQIKQTGGAFGDTLAITSLAPGARFPASPNVLTVRITVPAATNAFGPHEARLLALPGTWS